MLPPSDPAFDSFSHVQPQRLRSLGNPIIFPPAHPLFERPNHALPFISGFVLCAIRLNSLRHIRSSGDPIKPFISDFVLCAIRSNSAPTYPLFWRPNHALRQQPRFGTIPSCSSRRYILSSRLSLVFFIFLCYAYFEL